MGGISIEEIDGARLAFSGDAVWLMNLLLGVIMYSIALDLRMSDFQRLARAPKPVLTGLASQFILLPAVTFLLILAVAPPASMALGMILVAACPGGNVSNFITHRAGGNAALSVSMTACATAAAIFMTPINIAFWGGLYGPTREILRETFVDPAQVAATVTVILILPLLAGMLTRARAPQLAGRLRGPMQWLSMGLFMVFVIAIIAGNADLFAQFFTAVAALVIAHNALAFAAGYGIATAARLSDYDRRAVTIETGIQNSGLGLALIFAFFDGLGGMAITAGFWGVWHLIAGMTLAAILGRRPAAGGAGADDHAAGAARDPKRSQ
ncbi:MAG: bile acid:sodium symporter family protein [Pseudomonadota bacterium]